MNTYLRDIAIAERALKCEFGVVALQVQSVVERLAISHRHGFESSTSAKCPFSV